MVIVPVPIHVANKISDVKTDGDSVQIYHISIFFQLDQVSQEVVEELDSILMADYSNYYETASLLLANVSGFVSLSFFYPYLHP